MVGHVVKKLVRTQKNDYWIINSYFVSPCVVLEYQEPTYQLISIFQFQIRIYMKSIWIRLVPNNCMVIQHPKVRNQHNINDLSAKPQVGIRFPIVGINDLIIIYDFFTCILERLPGEEHFWWNLILMNVSVRSQAQLHHAEQHHSSYAWSVPAILIFG